MPFDRRVELLRTFIARLEKTKEKYSNAALVYQMQVIKNADDWNDFPVA